MNEQQDTILRTLKVVRNEHQVYLTEPPNMSEKVRTVWSKRRGNAEEKIEEIDKAMAWVRDAKLRSEYLIRVTRQLSLWQNVGLSFDVKIVPDTEGFSVSFLDVPEALTSGPTPKIAKRMARDALLTAFEFYFERLELLPDPRYRFSCGDRESHRIRLGPDDYDHLFERLKELT